MGALRHVALLGPLLPRPVDLNGAIPTTYRLRLQAGMCSPLPCYYGLVIDAAS